MRAYLNTRPLDGPVSLIAAGKTRDLANFRTDGEIERGLFELPAGYRHYTLQERLHRRKPLQRPASGLATHHAPLLIPIAQHGAARRFSVQDELMLCQAVGVTVY